MSTGILWTIKIVVILLVIFFMTAAKEMGIPIIVKNIIGFGIVYAVWNYKPDKPNDDNNNKQELDKS
jgi:hypothetical protein